MRKTMFASELLKIKSSVYCKEIMWLKWFPRGVYEINTQNVYDATKMHKKNRRPYVCMRFSVYTEIKGSLRRWNCVCIEAFGSFNQRLLCCHGNACWTKVLWIFQQPPFLSNHLGSFHNPHNIQKFSWRGGRPIPSKLVKVKQKHRKTKKTIHAKRYRVYTNAKRSRKHHAC